MSLSSIPSYLLRVAASWLTGCFCMFAWWLIYLGSSDNRGLDQLMTELFKQADHNLSTIMFFSLPVGIVLGEILSGVWELIVSPLFEHGKENVGRARNLCSRPFEYFVTGLGYKLVSENCIGKVEKGNITVGEFASLFNSEKAYNFSEIHFALARCLGGISIGLAGGLILGLALIFVDFLRKHCGKLIATIVFLLLVISGLTLNQTLFYQSTQAPMIHIFVLVSFVGFWLPLRYRDFANFIIVISKCCDAPFGKTGN